MQGCDMRIIDSIELHDSVVVIEDRGANELVLHLRPAYVHHWESTAKGWRGVGRSQDATFRIAGGIVAPAVPGDGHMISGGWFRVGNEIYENLIPVPLARVGTVVAHLVLIDAEPVDITGTALSVELIGASRDIETLPGEWAPPAFGGRPFS